MGASSDTEVADIVFVVDIGQVYTVSFLYVIRFLLVEGALRMDKQKDVADFLKEESGMTAEHIDSFLTVNKIRELNRHQQIVTLAHLLAGFPWGEARTIEELLVTKRYGTCTARHSALKACYDVLGIPSSQVVSTFKWGEQSIRYPKNLLNILDEGEWDHGHNFLHVQLEDESWIDVDITWNPGLNKYGFLTLPDDWDGHSSFLGLHINNRWDNVDMKAKKIELIQALSPELRERRERFLHLFVEWVHEINKIQ